MDHAVASTVIPSRRMATAVAILCSPSNRPGRPGSVRSFSLALTSDTSREFVLARLSTELLSASIRLSGAPKQRGRPYARLTLSYKETIVSSNAHNAPARTGARSLRFPAGSALMVGAMLFAGIASAAGADMSEAQSRYQMERATCVNGQSHQDRATCLQEAGAALQEAARGNLGGGMGQYEQDQLKRCDAHPAEDREDCLRRMRGEGTTSGRFEGGSIYRELRTTTPSN